MEDNQLIDRLENEYQSLPDETDEIVQHLIELGYLPQLNPEVFTDIQISVAEEAFIADLKQADFEDFKRDALALLFDRRSVLLKYSRKATDIDEGYVFENLPMPGSTGMIARIIHYRLELFGLWSLPIHAPYGKITARALKQLALYCEMDELSAINQTADIEGISRMLIETRPNEDFILTFSSAQIDKKYKRKELNSFYGRLKNDLPTDSAFLKKFEKNVIDVKKRHFNSGFLSVESQDDFKNFVIRLIQVHQWQEGLYDGNLDGKVGDVSIQSLRDAVELDRENTGKKERLKEKELLLFVDGYCLLNGYYFLRKYMLESEEGSGTKLWEAIDEQLSRADQEERQTYLQNVEEIKKRLRAETEKAKVVNGFFRRIYCGIKKVLKRALNFVKKFIKDLGRLIKKAWGFIKRVFKAFFEDLKMGIKAFVEGVKFLFGRKEIITTEGNSFLISKFQLDADCLNLCQDPNSVLVQNHSNKTRYQFAAMNFSLRMVVEILNIFIKAVSVMLWPLLLIQIVKVFKRISEEFKKLKSSVNLTTQTIVT